MPIERSHHPLPGREALRMEGVRKVFGEPENPVVALERLSIELQPATFTAIMGPSGSGKTTFLQVAAGLEPPTDGRVFIDGAEVTGADETTLTKFRRGRVGFVFQAYNLLPTLSVLENPTLPLRLSGRRIDRGRAVGVLGRMGMADRLDRRPAQLSGGEQQRVAIARAVIADPALVLADEPTGALDSRSARQVLGLLAESVAELGQTVVMVTHDPVAASYADAVVFLADGCIAGRLERPSADEVAERMAHLGERSVDHEPCLGGC